MTKMSFYLSLAPTEPPADRRRTKEPAAARGEAVAARGPTSDSGRRTTAVTARPEPVPEQMNTSLVVYTGEDNDSAENHRYKPFW